MNSKINADVYKILKNPFIGIIFAVISVKVYGILTNRSPFHIRQHRFHHYQLGLVLLLLAIVKENPILIGFGSWLIVDDMDDLVKDFDIFFKL